MNEQIISECMNLGCKSEREAALILQVYLELCEVKKYWDVEYYFEERADRVLLRARKSKDGPLAVFAPSETSKHFAFVEMHQLTSLCKEANVGIVYLAIVAPDSTCVFYEIAGGLHPPESDESKRSRNEPRDQIDGILNRHRKIFEDAALCGTSAVLPLVSCKNPPLEDPPP